MFVKVVNSIANAVGDALGVEFNHFPITPEQVQRAARERQWES